MMERPVILIDEAILQMAEPSLLCQHIEDCPLLDCRCPCHGNQSDEWAIIQCVWCRRQYRAVDRAVSDFLNGDKGGYVCPRCAASLQNQWMPR